jgi:uncharacterized membrane protein
VAPGGANLHLLFWLTIVPVVTAWMGEHFAALPVAVYGTVLILAAVAYFILTRALVARHGRDSAIAAAVGRDDKGKLSVVIYAVAIPAALVEPRLACALYVAVAVIWLVPDRRIEKILGERSPA